MFAVLLIAAGIGCAFFASPAGIALITFVCAAIAGICGGVTGAFPIWYGIAAGVILQVGYVTGILAQAAVGRFRRRG